MQAEEQRKQVQQVVRQYTGNVHLPKTTLRISVLSIKPCFTCLFSFVHNYHPLLILTKTRAGGQTERQ